MEINRFDALTRALSTADSRRRTLHAFGSLLLGGVLGGFTATLGTDEDAAAKGKKHRKGHDDHKRSGHVQAAGKKRHKKHRHKNKHKDKDKDKPLPPLPPGCQNCGTCQKCQDGACVADPELNGVRCLDNDTDPGGECHVCQSGSCVRHPSRCCPDERPCPFRTCVPKTTCCPGKHMCPGDVCIPVGACCGEKPLCAECEEAVCENDEWVCRSTCQGDTICCMGDCIPPCRNGCDVDDRCGHCDKAPSGKVYCAGNHTCVPSAQKDRSSTARPVSASQQFARRFAIPRPGCARRQDADRGSGA